MKILSKSDHKTDFYLFSWLVFGGTSSKTSPRLDSCYGVSAEVFFFFFLCACVLVCVCVSSFERARAASAVRWRLMVIAVSRLAFWVESARVGVE